MQELRRRPNTEAVLQIAKAEMARLQTFVPAVTVLVLLSKFAKPRLKLPARLVLLALVLAADQVVRPAVKLPLLDIVLALKGPELADTVRLLLSLHDADA